MKTLTISKEDFKLIKVFHPTFSRAKGIQTNEFVIDWNSIMPVVEQIEDLGIVSNISGVWGKFASHICKFTKIEDQAAVYARKTDDCKLTTVYATVVEFIKRYNAHPELYVTKK